ncbi:MAG TPA: hypothetical protein ENK14_00350 [Caldithrix sp.]|nr:hypothetical protein [Caldithrix sp.]
MTHKRYKKKYLSILLIPDDESSPKSLKIRYSVLRIGAVIAILVVLLFFIGVFSYGKLVQEAFENVSLRQENAQMAKQVQRVNEMAAELNKLKQLSEKVRNSLTGYVKITEDVEKLPKQNPADRLKENSIETIFTSIPVKAPVTGFISQEFKRSVHTGIDIVAPQGTPVVASADGSVLYSGWTMDGGYTIIIGHTNGYYTFYKHNLRNLVYNNQRVKQGEVIAYLGNSGEKSYGPHLHFEIWKDGKPIDPRKLIPRFD